MKKDNQKSQIVIYQTEDGQAMVNVCFQDETVWLSQKLMAELFEVGIPTINEHLKNIFFTRELKENSVVRNFRITASDGKKYETKHYNLDAIIALGYRINSKRATQFRVWATKILKQYLIKGYAINEKRLLEAQNKFKELQEAVSFLREKSKHELLSGQEKEIFDLLADYSKTLTLLEQYDTGKLSLSKKVRGKFKLSYEKAGLIILEIKRELSDKKEASGFFGQECGEKLKGIIGAIYQSFGGKELYFSLEEKAAHLLYFIVKDHPFSDGNKRVASFLFVYFLDKNNYLYRASGERKINDNALTALALLIAISNPKDKDVMIKIITNLIK